MSYFPIMAVNGRPDEPTTRSLLRDFRNQRGEGMIRQPRLIPCAELQHVSL